MLKIIIAVIEEHRQCKQTQQGPGLARPSLVGGVTTLTRVVWHPILLAERRAYCLVLCLPVFVKGQFH